MQKEVIHTNAAPAAIGPYSQGISSGSLIFVSGQLGIDPVTGNLKAGIQEQTLQSLKNLKAILEESGASMKSVLKTTVFLKDINDFSLVNEIYGQYFEEPYPARSAIEVAQLPKQGLVEIEAIAAKL